MSTNPPETPVEVALKVSALIIAGDQRDLVRATLAGLERTAPREMLEILMVDLGSSDGSRELDAEFPHVKLLRMDRNFGWTRAANIGTRTAQGEYLFVIPAGVEVAADTVAKLAARLDADSTLMAVAPWETGPNGEVRSKGYRLPGGADFSARLSTGDWPGALEPPGGDFPVEQPGGAPLLIRRQAIVQINYFDTRFGQFGADLDLYHQIRRAGKKILVIASVPVVVNASRNPELAHGFDPADFVHGAAEYLGKWHGFLAGLSFRLGAALRFLGQLDFGSLGKVLLGAKLDGN